MHVPRPTAPPANLTRPASLSSFGAGFKTIVPQVQAVNSAAQYALASVVTPILDGHPAGRSFNVPGRAPLYSIPPQARTGFFPYAGIGSLGGFGGSSGGIGSNYSPPRSIANAGDQDDGGVSLSSSESEDEQDLEKLRELLKKQEELKKKRENLEKANEYASDPEKVGEKVAEIEKIKEAEAKLQEKIDDAIKQIEEATKDKDGKGLSPEEIKDKILKGDYQDILEEISKLDPQTKKELHKLIESGHTTLGEYDDLFGAAEDEGTSLSSTQYASLSKSAPFERNASSLGLDGIFGDDEIYSYV